MLRRIFVVGNSRSGTTMVARMLGKHSEIMDLNELHFIEQAVTEEQFFSSNPVSVDESLRVGAYLVSVIEDGYFNAEVNSEKKLKASKILSTHRAYPRLQISQIYSHVCDYYALQNEKKLPLDQTPRNVFFISTLLKSYPDARVICMVRDPRDVLQSQKGKWKRRFLGGNIPLFESFRSWANYHPYIASKIWKSAVISGAAYSGDSRVMVVKFEDIVSSPEINVRKICSHCQVPFEKILLDVEQLGSSERLDKDTAKGFDQSRVEAWKSGVLSSVEISICDKVTSEARQLYGYSDANITINKIIIIFIYLSLPFKLCLSLILNISRVKSLRTWIKKRIFN